MTCKITHNNSKTLFGFDEKSKIELEGYRWAKKRKDEKFWL